MTEPPKIPRSGTKSTPIEDQSLRGHEHRLWLKDPLALFGVKSALLEPGYRSPDKTKGEP